MTSLPANRDRMIAELYAAHWERLVRLAWLLLRDQSAAEDVVQDAYVATHRNWASIRESGRVVGYLQTAVVNGCRSLHRHTVVVDRHHAREVAAAEALGRAGHESAESHVLRAAEHSSMVEILATLPGRQREVLVLRYYCDLSEAQIAHVLDISRGSVKAHVHRGLSALRAALQPDPAGADAPTDGVVVSHPRGTTTSTHRREQS